MTFGGERAVAAHGLGLSTRPCASPQAEAEAGREPGTGAFKALAAPRDPWAESESVSDRAPTLKFRDIPTWEVVVLAKTSATQATLSTGLVRGRRVQAGVPFGVLRDGSKDLWAQAELGEDGENVWQQFTEILVQGER